MGTTLITSRDPKGLQAVSLFEAVYNKAKLDAPRAQQLNERGGEFQDGILKLINELTISNQFADEEVSSEYTYPKEFKQQPLNVQIEVLCKYFPQLSPDLTLQFIQNELPKLTLPEGAEGWMAIPKWEKIATAYSEAVQKTLDAINSTRNFYNYRSGEINENQLRMHPRTAHALDLLAEQQPGDILIIAMQYGMLHRGQSVRRARELFNPNEFGLGSFALGCLALTHPQRYMRWEELDTDCVGDEFKPGGALSFSRAPIFNFYDDKLKFASNDVSHAYDYYGSASAFLPQQK